MPSRDLRLSARGCCDGISLSLQSEALNVQWGLACWVRGLRNEQQGAGGAGGAGGRSLSLPRTTDAPKPPPHIL